MQIQFPKEGFICRLRILCRFGAPFLSPTDGATARFWWKKKCTFGCQSECRVMARWGNSFVACNSRHRSTTVPPFSPVYGSCSTPSSVCTKSKHTKHKPSPTLLRTTVQGEKTLAEQCYRPGGSASAAFLTRDSTRLKLRGKKKRIGEEYPWRISPQAT